MKFKINITQKIIDNGRCSSPSNCAFAIAYSELVPVRVGVVIGFLGRGEFNTSEIPISCIGITSEQAEWILKFDMDKTSVKPRSFEVEIPDEVIEYWYGDAVKAAQHIANSEVLIPA